jgi:hypothetical protein
LSQLADHPQHAVGQVGVRRQVEVFQVGKRLGNHFDGRIIDDRIGQGQRRQVGQAAELRGQLVVHRAEIEDLELFQVR